MSMLLVLGSKPEPVLPPRAAIDALACANASGHSAALLGLPRPTFTVMSAILSSGIGSGDQSIAALAGLATEDLWYYARPRRRGLLQRWRRRHEDRLTTPEELQRRLRAVDYRWERFHDRANGDWHETVARQAGGGDDLRAAIASKQPSTGVAAIALGLELGRWQRVCVAGFSFELTHAYADNPEITERGTAVSKHAETDVAALIAMARRHPGLCTTEPVVHQRTGLPLLGGERGEEAR
ncbi:MAG: hypothetical protein H6807_00935 [Planctomycetes bacterium]|nr:hypothetical protein [Planctomycetota bacterium]